MDFGGGRGIRHENIKTEVPIIETSNHLTMELIDKIKAIIDRLEKIKNLSRPNIASLKEQIDVIENEEVLKLEEEFEDWVNCLYDESEPDGETDKLIDKIRDLFIQADKLIATIRQQFGIEDIYDDIDEQDGELCRMVCEEEYDSDAVDEKEYDIVLNEVSKSALKVIGLDVEDEQNINLMGLILVGVFSEESDETIAKRAFDQLVISGFILPMDDIKEICKDVREKCKKQLFLLQIAIDSMREYKCSGIDALTQIQLLL